MECEGNNVCCDLQMDTDIWDSDSESDVPCEYNCVAPQECDFMGGDIAHIMGPCRTGGGVKVARVELDVAVEQGPVGGVVPEGVDREGALGSAERSETGDLLGVQGPAGGI